MTKKLSEAEKAERAKQRQANAKPKPGTKPVKQSAKAQEHEAEGQQVRQLGVDPRHFFPGENGRQPEQVALVVIKFLLGRGQPGGREVHEERLRIT